MSHLAAFLLSLAGFAALACATRRQQRDLFGRALRQSTTYLLRAIGACALFAALGVLVESFGWGLALVMFSGHTSLAAGIVFAVLIVNERREAGTSHRR